jgi:hypothetical protein
MGYTFAANGVYVGAAVGLLAGISTKSVGIGIVVAIGVSVAAWYAIRAFEKMLGRGVSAGFTAAQNRMNRPRPPAQYQPPPPGGYEPPAHTGHAPQYGQAWTSDQNGRSYPTAAQPPLGQAPHTQPGQ